MTISATMVRDLREKTGAGIMECKQALAESAGDLEKAVDILRKRGLKVAEKKAGRAAADGLVSLWVSPSRNAGAVVEVNCETDFVARTDKFQALVRQLLDLVAQDASIASVEDLLARSVNGMPVPDVVKETIGALGENIVVRRAARLAVPAGTPGLVAGYLHGAGKIGVLVEAHGAAAESEPLAKLAKDIALQVCSAEPHYLTRTEVPPEVLEREREVLRAQPDLQGKPAAIQDKIIGGRLEKFYAERCLVDQLFIKDPEGKQKVKDVVAASGKAIGRPIQIARFVRFRLGEGVEKRAAD